MDLCRFIRWILTVTGWRSCNHMPFRWVSVTNWPREHRDYRSCTVMPFYTLLRGHREPGIRDVTSMLHSSARATFPLIDMVWIIDRRRGRNADSRLRPRKFGTKVRSMSQPWLATREGMSRSSSYATATSTFGAQIPSDSARNTLDQIEQQLARILHNSFDILCIVC